MVLKRNSPEERGAHRAFAKLDVGCEFIGIRIPLSADLKHSTPRGVLLSGCLAAMLMYGADHGVLRHATSIPVLLRL